MLGIFDAVKAGDGERVVELLTSGVSTNGSDLVRYIFSTVMNGS